MPEPRSDHAVVVTADSLIVFGGRNIANKGMSDLWKYDLNNNMWAEQPASGTVSPSARYWHGMVLAGEGSRLYMFGGYDMHDDLNDLWRYAIGPNEWTQVTPRTTKPLPRDRFSMTIRGNEILVFGGYVGTYVNDFWKYSISDNTWSEITASTPPSKRRSHGSAVSGSKMFVFGGTNGDQFLSDLWEFDFVHNTWTEIRSQVRPAKRSRAQLAADNVGRLYLFGGFDGTQYKSDLWRHSDGEGWTKLEPEYDTFPRVCDGMIQYHASSVARDKGRLYVFGGADETQKYNDVFKYEISSNQLRELNPIPSDK
eukprot:c16518_g1_i1.p1 GENE.c16518_g1_i1~~c16518_g1_i1.p1  ORF type:complete len:353 (+),score=85.91 c16518_g1_i1:127-1059(+)